MKDVIISAIANYSADQIRPYVNSINKSGFHGDKIMVGYNLPSNTISYLHDNGWEILEGKLQGHPHMQRLVDIYYALHNSEVEYRFVITTDVRDVVFQLNPSEYLQNNLKSGVLVSSENVLYKNEPWGVKNILEGYGPMYLDRYGNHVTCNVGVLAGRYKDMKDLLLLNYLVSQAGDTRHFTDQSSFNFVIHNELVKSSIQIEGLETNWTLQVGTLSNPNLLGAYTPHIVNGKVMQKTEPFVVVHQYDRDAELRKTILEIYNA